MASDSTPDSTSPTAPETATGAPPATGAVPARPPRRVSRFAAWRWRRPFWGGLLLTVAGALVMATMVQGSLEVALASGARGVAGYILPAFMIVCGVLILFNPAQRIFYSVIGLLASLGSWATSNMGAFMIGTILGVAGSTLAFGWLPEQGSRRETRERRRRERAAGRTTAA